jgi:hypothetical protein
MNIQFDGKYKSIGSFEWNEIPSFVVITGMERGNRNCSG